MQVFMSIVCIAALVVVVVDYLSLEPASVNVTESTVPLPSETKEPVMLWALIGMAVVAVIAVAGVMFSTGYGGSEVPWVGNIRQDGYPR